MIVESVNLSRGNRRWLRWATIPILLDIILSVGLTWTIVDSRTAQHRQCERQNEANGGQLALWGPILAAPRAPLPPNATAAERAAYDDATRARENFQRDLHRYFDPTDC